MIKATRQRGARDLEGCLHIDGPMSVCVCVGGGGGAYNRNKFFVYK